jgi:hypothetical protein
MSGMNVDMSQLQLPAPVAPNVQGPPQAAPPSQVPWPAQVNDPAQQQPQQAPQQAPQAPPQAAPQQQQPNPAQMQQQLQQIAQTPMQPVPQAGPDQGASPVKRFLTNFFYGAGQAALQHVGLPTDYDKQQAVIQHNDRQQEINQHAAETSSLIGLHQQQGQLAAVQAARQSDEESFMAIGPQGAAITGLSPDTQVRKKDYAGVLVAGMRGNFQQGVADTRAGASTANNAATNQTKLTTNAANNQNKLTAQQMRDATSSGNVAQRLNAAAGVPGQPAQPKPTVADRNRQSLAKIALDSLADVEDVVKRRPDKIGMLAGRATNVEQMLGSNDPDLVAIGNAVHNFAMANAGIHGSRSHENVVDAENMLLNHMRNGPEGMMGGIRTNQNNLNRIINGGNAPAPNASGGAPSTAQPSSGGADPFAQFKRNRP